MAAILIVAHSPLAGALRAVAVHAYCDCEAAVVALDVPADIGLEEATARVAAALAAWPGQEVLVMVDAFGATPANAALAAVDGVRERVVTGVNVPMLWRTLCYADLPLAELVTRAADGARQGIMQVAQPRRQNQPQRPFSDDPDAHSDQ
ncbi:MAG: PTS fructose transporter subunit IIA [Rubrivivax sp.]|nr:PTS fructose transporter subunit IIA [Rubrivivax sp.]